MCAHWISAELRQEYRDQRFSSSIDQNGCDITISAVDGKTIYSHGMILSCQSPIFRRAVKEEKEVVCRWQSEVVNSLLRFMYGLPCELDNPNSIVELLLCATYYQIEWLCEKLTTMLEDMLSSAKTPVREEDDLGLCYKLCLLLQDMDVENRGPFDPLVGPLFEFCCDKIQAAASSSNFPEKLDISETIDNIMATKWPIRPITPIGEPLQLLLTFFPSVGQDALPLESIRQMLKFQLFGRIHSVQEMMLFSVKDAQREFPSVIYFREEAAQLIKVGDKVIQEDNTPEKYFHSRHAGIGLVSDFCGPKSAGIGCGGCKKHVYVDWGEQKCWCRMGYENLFELKLLR